MGVARLMVLSAIGASVSTGILLIAGYFLDRVMEPQYATAIALVVSAAINFVLQKKVFRGSRKLTGVTLWKYAVATSVITIANQVGHNYLVEHEQDYKRKLPEELRSYYMTVSRGVVAVFVFLVISFPIRKMWVFA